MILFSTPTHRWQMRLLVFLVIGLGPVVSYLTFGTRYSGLTEADTPSLWLFWTLLGTGLAFAVTLPLTWIATENYRSKAKIFSMPLHRVTWRRIFSWLLALGMLAVAVMNFISCVRYGVLGDAAYGLIVLWCGLHVLASCGEGHTA